MWDYDPDTRTITATGAVVPATCPVEVHPQAAIYTMALGVWSLLDKGQLRLDEVSSAWHHAALRCHAIMSEVADG